ncbi:hypothetical protein, partial [Deinococcus fonticola]|uniref:hypothetical protein n=1 Tax=Deinococcus fonticola TaxID=2528713 RepID=UPI00197AA33C
MQPHRGDTRIAARLGVQRSSDDFAAHFEGDLLVQRSINTDSLIVPTKAATGILGRELPIDLYPRCISGAHPGF